MIMKLVVDEGERYGRRLVFKDEQGNRYVMFHGVLYDAWWDGNEWRIDLEPSEVQALKS